MAHYKISNRGSQILIFHLLVFDRIHDAMHLNKMSRTSSRKTGPHNKDPAVYLNVDMGYFFIPVLSRFMDLCAHSVFVYVGGPARCACQRCLVTVHLTR